MLKFSKNDQAERNAVIEATRRYLKEHGSVADPLVGCDKLEGGFARVSAQDPQGQAPNATGFAKRTVDGRWKVLAIGTLFDAAFYQKHGIPAGLHV